MKKSKYFKASFEEYSKYKNIIKKTLNSISNLNLIDKETDLIKLGKEEELFSEFLLFLNFPESISLDTSVNFQENNNNWNILNELEKVRIYSNDILFNGNIFKIQLHLQIFLLSKLENFFSQKSEKLDSSILHIKEINHYYQILIQILLILLKNYKEKKVELNKIILFFSSIFIFIINNNKNIEDKYLKIKNIFFLRLLIEKYFGYFLTLLSNEREVNKNDIILMFCYILKVLNNTELKENFNYEILIKTGLINNFISIILNFFKENKNIDIYRRYKDELINCFFNIFKNNTYGFNFFELLINQNKQSFINLANYKERKALIIKDFYSQNFCIELLYKLFNDEKNLLNNIKTEDNYFIFNGYNSKMTFNLNEFSLKDSYIFFSFQLSKEVINFSSVNFPLINFESQTGGISFKLYIHKENNDNYKLYLFQENGNNKNINKSFDKIGNILLDEFYLLAIKFLDGKIAIFINDLKGNNPIIFEENDILNVDDKTQILKIGHYDQKEEYFKGYIGPFFIITFLKFKNNFRFYNLITTILNLRNLYKFFPFSLSESSTFNFDEKIFFNSSQEKNQIKSIKSFFAMNIEKFKCEMYLTPEMFNIYHSLILKNEKEENCFLPEILNVTSEQKYKIINTNISLSKKSYILIDFLQNNGFDFFILLFEYYYQFLKLLESNKNEFEFYLNDNNLENTIISSINSMLSILSKNFRYHKYIITYIKKYKTLFRNLHEILKIGHINITQNILKELYECFFQIEKELKILRFGYELKEEEVKILSNFSKGLIDIIYDHQIYLNLPNNNNLNLLIQQTINILNDYKNNNQNISDLYFLTDNFFEKLLRLIKPLENSFTDDYNEKNSIIDSYLNLIKIFFNSINNKERKHYYYRQLYIFVIENYKNNLKVIMNILNFANEIISENPELEDFELFINIFLNQNQEKDKEEEKNENQKLILNFNAIVFNILLKISFIDNSKEKIKQVNTKLENINNLDMISALIPELGKIFPFFLTYGIINEKENNIEIINKINPMKLFGKIFNFIINLFELIITKFQSKISEKIYEELNKKIDESFSKLLNILEDLEKELSNFQESNINYMYCLINFLIFYYRIIFYERKILQFSDVKFIENLINIIQLCDKYFLLNSFQLFKFKIANIEYQKTIIEIIYDILIQFFLNNENSEECYSKLLEEYNFILYDRQLENVQHSIFYVNDYMNYLLKKDIFQLKIDFDLKDKLQKLINYKEEYFVGEDIFNGNLVTYFLYIILENQKKINEQKEFKIFISPISRLIKFYDDLFIKMLEEHSILYKLDKKYFFKKISSNYPIELLKYIKKNYVKKKKPPSIEEIKGNIEKILEKFKKENDKNLINTKQNLEEIKIVFEPQKAIKNENNIMIQTPVSDNKTHFFYDLDKNYITNIKKEIMNCIFSYYYLDEFFYSSDFCIIKKYYINNYLNIKENWDTKKLNFPSTIKNYRNNFEPPLFVKKFNNYVLDPYFSISHSYIKNESLKSKLIFEKSIKLCPKEIFNVVSDKEIECEFIKNENAFYGKLYYNDCGNYLLFKEETKDFSEEQNFEHIFLLSNFFENNLKKNTKKDNFDKRLYSKNILIILDDIEEIIEMRILLLWKGCEIYLKNGKSYIFNFLTTQEYNYFMTNFINKSKINNLVRKRNFLSDQNSITKYWVKSLLTNYEYLLILNRYSSRSFNDSSQYPVFPWLLNDYKNLDLFYKQKKYYKIIKNEYKKTKIKIKNNKGKKLNLEKEDFSKNDIFIMKIIKNLIQDELKKTESFYLEYIISKLETIVENRMNEEIQRNKIEEKNFYKNNNKNNEVYLRYNIEDIDTFNYSQFFKFFRKANNKIKTFLRNFKYPPSINDESKKSFLQYRFDQEFYDQIFSFHYGRHYSTSSYIYYFLMRQQPYDNLLIKTQSYKLEDPNRTFRNLIILNELTNEGSDNRELIPELFSKIEMFLNLNCDLYEKTENNNKIIVDDYEIDHSGNNNNKYPVANYVDLILKHKNILNDKLIGIKLNNWIDIIFGEKQLPSVDKRRESCNIYEKESYEQMINLEKKLAKYLMKKENDFKDKINLKIDHIINFGVTPSQLFKKEHPKLEWIIQNNDNKNNEKDGKSIKNFKNNSKEEQCIEEIEEEIIKPKQIICKINGNPLFFCIQRRVNKIFVYNKEDNFKIIDYHFFKEIDYNYYNDLNDNIMKKANILYSNENQEYQIKYSFSSFIKKNSFNEDNSYHTDYYKRINSLINAEKINHEFKNYNFDNFIMITCRHIDCSFKIHYFEAKNQKTKNNINEIQNKNKIKIYSFMCEDFVTCCLCISTNSFMIGLNNGKLIYYILNEKEIINDNNQVADIKTDITIKKEMYIQGHHGKINTIGIDMRLGVVMTSGDDNYIFLRKLYDFELLLPIKIKAKYSILITKISLHNFLYVLCFNKKNNKKIIFGYTLSGIKFAKSKYDLYDNINFDEEGNVITTVNKNDFTILSGSDLTKLNNTKDGKVMSNEIQKSNWLKFDYFLDDKDKELSRIITFLENKNGNNFIKACIYK